MLQSFCFNRMHLEISSAKWWQFCLSLRVLTALLIHTNSIQMVRWFYRQQDIRHFAQASMYSRQLHNPNLVVIGLSKGYDTWPPIGWHCPFVIVWSKYSLGKPSAPLHYGVTWPVGIPTVFETPVTVPLVICTALTTGKCLPLGLCKGTLKKSTCTVIILCMHPADERRRCDVKSSLIGWTDTQNVPWMYAYSDYG